MQAIHKYPLDKWPRRQHIRMPRLAKLLSVGEQESGHYLWALVNNDNPIETRVIQVCYTGSVGLPVGPHVVFVGTINVGTELDLAHHVFDLGPSTENE